MDQDGFLSRDDLSVMIDGCVQLMRDETSEAKDGEKVEELKQSTDEMVHELLTSHATEGHGLTVEQYLQWAESSRLIDCFLDVLYQVNS